MTATADNRRALLARWPQREQSHLANIFLWEYRKPNIRETIDGMAPVSRPKALVLFATQALRAKHGEAVARGDREDAEKWRHWIATIEKFGDEAREFAAWCIEWEGLPREEKERRKALQAERYRQQHMTTQPPTGPQIRYCRSLGHEGEIRDRQHASEIITALRVGRR